MRPTIYLDIDGVLNSGETWAKGETRLMLDVALVERFNRITDATDADVVLSSAWRGTMRRHLAGTRNALRRAGMRAAIAGATPNLTAYGAPRWTEIAIDLLERAATNGGLGRFVVIDDDRDAYTNRPPFTTLGRFLGTHPQHGLEDRHVRAAIAWLNGEGT